MSISTSHMHHSHSLEMESMKLCIDQYSMNIVTNVHEGLCCLLCHKVLKSPQQGPCGCRYCYDCIKDFLKEADRMCPGSLEECQNLAMNFERDVHPDQRAKRELNKLIVKCPFSTCGEEYEFRVMKDHLKMCAISIVSCPACNGPLSKEEYDNHVDNECTEVAVTCEYCHISMTRGCLRSIHHNYEHDNLCHLYVNYCPNECGEEQQVLWLEHRRLCSCSKIVSCPYSIIGCPSNTGTLGEISRHLQNNAIEHSEIMLKHIDNLNNEISSLNSNIATVAMEVNAINVEHNEKERLEKERNAHEILNINKTIDKTSLDQTRAISLLRNFTIKQVDAVMRKRDRDHAVEVEKLNDKIANMKSDIENIKREPGDASLVEISKLESGNKRTMILVWVINGLTENLYFQSPEFYTDIMGYKLDMVVDRNNKDFMAILVRLKCGEFDNQLQWPFRKCLTVRIVDQEKLSRDYEKVIPINHSSGRASERKYMSETGDLGFREFISMETLYKNNYLLKNDKICIVCFVDSLDS